MNEISRIDVIVDGDHGQGAFRFLMKLSFVMKSSKNLNVHVVMLIFCAKKNGDILKNTIIEKLQEPCMLMLDPIKIGNHPVSINNLYVSDDLAFLVILLGEEF